MSALAKIDSKKLIPANAELNNYNSSTAKKLLNSGEIDRHTKVVVSSIHEKKDIEYSLLEFFTLVSNYHDLLPQLLEEEIDQEELNQAILRTNDPDILSLLLSKINWETNNLRTIVKGSISFSKNPDTEVHILEFIASSNLYTYSSKKNFNDIFNLFAEQGKIDEELSNKLLTTINKSNLSYLSEDNLRLLLADKKVESIKIKDEPLICTLAPKFPNLLAETLEDYKKMLKDSQTTREKSEELKSHLAKLFFILPRGGKQIPLYNDILNENPDIKKIISKDIIITSTPDRHHGLFLQQNLPSILTSSFEESSEQEKNDILSNIFKIYESENTTSETKIGIKNLATKIISTSPEKINNNLIISFVEKELRSKHPNEDLLSLLIKKGKISSEYYPIILKFACSKNLPKLTETISFSPELEISATEFKQKFGIDFPDHLKKAEEKSRELINAAMIIELEEYIRNQKYSKLHDKYKGRDFSQYTEEALAKKGTKLEEKVEKKVVEKMTKLANIEIENIDNKLIAQVRAACYLLGRNISPDSRTEIIGEISKVLRNQLDIKIKDENHILRKPKTELSTKEEIQVDKLYHTITEILTTQTQDIDNLLKKGEDNPKPNPEQPKATQKHSRDKSVGNN